MIYCNPHFLCPTKDHLVVDLDIKLVTSTAKMVEQCLSIIYLEMGKQACTNYS